MSLGLTQRGVKRALLLAIGGGGDIAGTVPLYVKLSREGIKARLGAIIWERHVVDPVLGPISLKELTNAEPIAPSLAKIGSRTEAVRGDNVIKPQISRVLQVLGEDGIAVDVTKSVECIAEDLASYSRKEGIGAIIGVDVGGDSLAEGHEEGLRSPLSDAYGIAVLKRVRDGMGIPVALAVLGPGVDGELDQGYVLEKISEIARRGGYLGAVGIGREEADVMRKVLPNVITEASKLALEAAVGGTGERIIRGNRRIYLNLVHSIYFLLDIDVVYEMLPLPKLVSNSSSIWEARRILNSAGVRTEIDLEEELARALKTNRVSS